MKVRIRRHSSNHLVDLPQCFHNAGYEITQRGSKLFSSLCKRQGSNPAIKMSVIFHHFEYESGF